MKKINRRNYIQQRILLLIALMLIFNTVKGQEDSVGYVENVIPKSWFELGIGGKKPHLFFGGSLFFRVADGMAIGIRSGNAVEVRDPFINPWEFFWDLTPAASYTPLVGSAGMVSGFIGIGIAGGLRRGEFLRYEGLVVEQYEEIRFRRFCIAFGLSGAIFIPGTRGLALAASVFSNINSEKRFTGFNIGLQFRETR